MHWATALSTLAVILRYHRTRAAASATTPAPLSLPPSQYFDGDDGWWSSFQIQVGTPPQALRVLPASSALAGTTIWVVLAEGCWEANPNLPNCPNLRGYTFTRNESTTWSTQRLANDGLYQLNTFEEVYLGLTGSAYYGFDTVNLGVAGQSLPTLENQLVAGFATDNYWLGSLGLSPASFNISNLDNPIPSLLGTLYNQSYVPSSSWSYTAGAFYQIPPAYGSLTFGGYDSTRMDSNHTLSDIAFGPLSARGLVVQLQTVAYNTIGAEPLLTAPIEIFIDSMVSSLWLPLEVCHNFEKAFNLTWNTNSSLYTVDEDVHAALLAQNPTFTFTLGNETGGETVDVVFPYAAFDLNVTLPITNRPSRYFPLQRAENSTQYTLGRVFLQEAYVIADYDRQTFSISQALFPATSVPQQLVAICAPDNDAACRRPGSGRLSTGAIVGIIVGVILLICLVATAVIWLRRSRRRQHYPTETKAMLSKSEAEAPDTMRHEMDPGNGQHEMAPGNEQHEMDPGEELRPELGEEGKDMIVHNRHEMPTSWRPPELSTQDIAAHELEAPSIKIAESD